ncbi:rod shape-determining protein MreD [Marinobacterium nitratireducens]|uniref:Rod shape-determining protein MreD n=1 Tax=Marinobacterium nitratireducens TaxID=518897 RepID=A0A917ZIL4_9GAMM|nr:rod shape-determining protein MreD [Marinobacterium nitratireducens]GGO82819.1 rod shape-determining protein MreD [Marinobacterium nitratireducens]
MSEARPGGFLIIFGTFLVGLVLSQLPLPDTFEWGRPEWVPMILIYWVLALPHRVGLGMAWMFGLALDLLKGSPLGLNALSLTLIAFLTLLIHQRLRMFPLWKQALMVMVLVGINQLTFHWMQAIAGNARDSFMFMLPSLVSALLWPWVFVLLRSIRRTFRVT